MVSLECLIDLTPYIRIGEGPYLPRPIYYADPHQMMLLTIVYEEMGQSRSLWCQDRHGGIELKDQLMGSFPVVKMCLR